jgi:hypothetical protein
MTQSGVDRVLLLRLGGLDVLLCVSSVLSLLWLRLLWL